MSKNKISIIVPVYNEKNYINKIILKLKKDIKFSKQIIIVCLIFILPITDTTSVFINRIYRRKSPFIGGKDHATHHLSFLGFNNTQIIFIFSGISFLSSLIAIALYRFGNEWSNFKFFFCTIYLSVIFIALYISTQQHKDLRK